MFISEEQLETWAHIGAQVTAKETADTIRRAIANYSDWPEGISLEDYLQGSYRNNTNIRGDSDVDLVVQLNSSYYSNLTEEEKDRLGLPKTSYGFEDFRTDVLKAVRRRFGNENILEGNKSIKLKAVNGRLAADIVVCVLYKKYIRTDSVNSADYIEGMTFWTRIGDYQIISYPKIHYNNGTIKNNRANNQYKKTVRMFKNIRSHLVDRGKISEDCAPSYFLECFIYNISDGNFSGNYQNIFTKCVNYLNDADFNDFICQDEQQNLFGQSDQQWEQDKAKELISEMINLWNNW